ncbi:MAG: carboxylating nicotinate-nucleotide diphosphorylase [Chloroflexota bacterium]|nr:carboxylating nicotinate-nucleotide diphosphorylase [Chloroflexota bacterium]
MEDLPADLQRAAEEAVKRALAEDVGEGDFTTLWIIPAQARAEGCILSKEEGIVAGLAVAKTAFAACDPELVFEAAVADGQLIQRGQVLGRVRGRARSILTAERTALNFLQRMSGIATMTHRYVRAVRGTKAVILDTRKTAPGLRPLDKWAVRLGGGQNHRMGLYDMVLIKDNHIAATGGIAEAVKRVREKMANGESRIPIEVEVKTLAELREALDFDLDRIMLDNMTIGEMREAVGMAAGRVPLEASGGVNLETVRKVAETGVDYISIGALTHSVPALDISLEVDETRI